MLRNVSPKLLRRVVQLPQRSHVIRIEMTSVDSVGQDNTQRARLGLFIVAHEGMVSYPKPGTAIARLKVGGILALAQRPEVRWISTHRGYVS